MIEALKKNTFLKVKYRHKIIVTSISGTSIVTSIPGKNTKNVTFDVGI